MQLPGRLRSRALIVVLSLVLLTAGIAFVWFSRSTSATPANFATYFPERDATVLYIDVSAVRASGILDKLVGSTVGEAADYRTFIQQSGFDYKRDLNKVMLNSAGGIHYFVLQGRFDWERLSEYATSQGGTCRDGYCFMKGSTPDRVISWRRLRRDMMALASARDESGARAIDRRAASPVPFDIPDSPVWLHLPASALQGSSQLPPGTRMFVKALEPAERTLLTLGPSQDRFQLGMNVLCRNPEEAAVLKAQLDGITKLLTSLINREKKAPNPGDLSGVLTSGTFERIDRRVHGKWTIERSFLNSLGGS